MRAELATEANILLKILFSVFLRHIKDSHQGD